MSSLYPTALTGLARAASSRLRGRVSERAPSLAVDLEDWMRALAGGAEPEDYFLHAQAFPMLLLPWWLEESLRGAADVQLQAEFAYSSMSGYYFVRLVDDWMDGERPPEPRLLPGLIVLHTEFQHAYGLMFPADHRFWHDFLDICYEAAETASIDAGLADVERDDFQRVSSRKIAGAKLPLAAVCHVHGDLDLLEPWTSFVDLLGRWHQMLNDVRDWRRDLERGAMTYFLSEGRRRAGDLDSVAEWVVAEGLEWGMGELDGWMAELLAAATQLRSPGLIAYLEERRRMQEREWEGLRAHLDRLRALAQALA